MTLDAMRCLCAVLETGSFRRAAERVHRSQPAVSQQVQALERELGRTLVERKTCTPTPAGRRFYERARRLVNDADGLAQELADLDETSAQTLRVGAGDTTALYFLPPVVRAFSRAMPKTRLDIVNRHDLVHPWVPCGSTVTPTATVGPDTATPTPTATRTATPTATVTPTDGPSPKPVRPVPG